MFLLLLAHLGYPGQNPEGRKTVCVCVCVFTFQCHHSDSKEQQQNSGRFVITRKLCYCKDDRAMHLIYECPESFLDSLTTLMDTFPKLL